MKIILASNSAIRKKLMDSLEVPYKIIPANIDEKKIRDRNLRVRSEKIARAKAEFVAKNNGGIIIAADTFGSVNGQVLEKPKNLEEAKEMLKLQSDKECLMYTGFCYIDRKNDVDFSDSVEIKYTFRKLSDEEINYQIKNVPVLQYSAAFAPNDPNQISLIAEMDGSFTGLMYGIPAEILIPLLQKSGVKSFSR